MRTIEGSEQAAPFRFGLVVSKYHDFITERLKEGAVSALAAAGADVESLKVIRVPGAFEIPLAARRAAESGQFDAIICLGCLVRGEAPHFEYIASAVSKGLIAASGETGVPMTFGVLTTNSVEEALSRAGNGSGNKGHEAAMAAVEMASLVGQLAATPKRRSERGRRAANPGKPARRRRRSGARR